MQRRRPMRSKLLLARLSWREIEDVICLRNARRHRSFLSERGLLDIANMEDETFRRQFRFHKEDLAALQSALQIPATVTSAQGVNVPGNEALCIVLRRLAYPNRLFDLEGLFNRHSSTLSSISNIIMSQIDERCGHLLSDMNSHSWLSLAKLEMCSQEELHAVNNKGAPLHNCWGFIDGTARPICRPSKNQKLYFYGHKRVHVVKYQAVMCANGIICQLDGPFDGHRHDAGMLRISGLHEKMGTLVQDHSYVIYGDPAYPMMPLLLKPHRGAVLTPSEVSFNKAMSTVRQAVEWGFEKVVTEFAFVDLKKNKQKVLLQRVPLMYRVATFLANCHTCLYGSQVTKYFHVDPPTLQEYLTPPIVGQT
ncbi:unnamed protein product [Ixodes hexagonus]